MRRTVEVVCSEAVAPGMATTGIPVHVAGDADAALARIEEIRDRGEAGVVLLEEGLHEVLEASGRIPLRARSDVSTGPGDVAPGEAGSAAGWIGPAILPFPGPVWVERPPAEEYVLEILRRAVGYRVKLR